MRKECRLATTVLIALLSGCAAIGGTADAPLPLAAQGTRPNVLVIVADDLGWSDLGSFGGEIATPNLDALARSGVRFTDFHTAPACSPTRAMLLTGVDNHRAGLGTMAELPSPYTQGAPGYETYLTDRVATIAELLQAGGYRTLMTGKWHLGIGPGREPAARGFERSLALLDGAANHFGADQGEAWRERNLAPSYRDDAKPVAYPLGAYSSDYFTDVLIGYIADGVRAGDRRPFFAYLAFTAPHWPLMAPRESIEKYKGRYDAGFEALQAERLDRQKALGLVSPAVRPHALELARPWSSLTLDERAVAARQMEIYAAMVDRMDQNVGQLVAELRRLGLYENTVIVFLADNGPDGRRHDSPDFRSKLPPEPSLGVDNRLDNLGSATSFTSYGPGWAQANSTPSRLFKGYTTEGGIRVAAFASGKGIPTGGRIADGNFDVRDVAPTLLDLAGLSQGATFRGHAILPFEGHSLRPVLAGRATGVRSSDEPLGYELFFHRALRKGDWKIVFIPLGAGTQAEGSTEGRWQLFNLASDPGETKDLSATRPKKLRELMADYDAYSSVKGVVPPPTDLIEGGARP